VKFFKQSSLFCFTVSNKDKHKFCHWKQIKREEGKTEEEQEQKQKRRGKWKKADEQKKRGKGKKEDEQKRRGKGKEKEKKGSSVRCCRVCSKRLANKEALALHLPQHNLKVLEPDQCWIFFYALICSRNALYQGILTEGEGLVQLTSMY